MTNGAGAEAKAGLKESAQQAQSNNVRVICRVMVDGHHLVGIEGNEWLEAIESGLGGILGGMESDLVVIDRGLVVIDSGIVLLK